MLISMRPHPENTTARMPLRQPHAFPANATGATDFKRPVTSPQTTPSVENPIRHSLVREEYNGIIVCWVIYSFFKKWIVFGSLSLYFIEYTEQTMKIFLILFSTKYNYFRIVIFEFKVIFLLLSKLCICLFQLRRIECILK